MNLSQFIPEIKIQPNILSNIIKVGQCFEDRVGDRYKVIKIYRKDGSILVNFESLKNSIKKWDFILETVENNIITNSWKIIPCPPNLAEIKIQPNTGIPKNPEELLQFIIKNYQEFRELYIKKQNTPLWKYSGFYLPESPSSEYGEIGLDDGYGHEDEDGGDNIDARFVDIVLVDNHDEQNGNLFCSLNPDIIDFVFIMEIKKVKIYCDITTL